jgi:nucleotide-binding universal stress UspA family protein
LLITSILVPVDGSDHAEKALNYALNLAEKHDAKVEIVTVVDEVKMAPDWAREYSEKLREQAEEALISTFSKAVKQKPNIKISKCLAEGYASEEILICAEKGHHDLIVMGSRGMGLVRGIFLGSVSSRVVNQAEIPVLIVK